MSRDEFMFNSRAIALPLGVSPTIIPRSIAK
jgi:hypothetical protein